MQDPGLSFGLIWNSSAGAAGASNAPLPMPPPVAASARAAPAPPAITAVPYQDLYFTLVVAGAVFGAIVVLRPVLAWLYRRFTPCGTPMQQLLRFPALETLFAGLLLVAVTLYACLTLSPRIFPSQLSVSSSQGWMSPEWDTHSYVAVGLLAGAVLPYTLFLWWMAMAAMYCGDDVLEHSVRARFPVLFSGPHHFTLSVLHAWSMHACMRGTVHCIHGCRAGPPAVRM